MSIDKGKKYGKIEVIDLHSKGRYRNFVMKCRCGNVFFGVTTQADESTVDDSLERHSKSVCPACGDADEKSKGKEKAKK